ncbi:regulatory protein RecX [Persephonella sp.]|uniref:regulatory protein RecX n=1 Tax=Persephonella sp. TaxID=2060922 RepID=UPI0026113C58|nr:regulatory protein RecX [Persephonella sp.]
MKKIKSVAFRLLAKKDYYKQELKQKLLQKGFNENQIEKVLDELEEKGYINDDKLIQRHKELAIQKGKSPLYLRKKLYQKGISQLDFSYEEELEAALNLLRNKYKKQKKFYDVVKFLKNRGFSYSVIQEAANKFLNEEE